jgi:hypothetical protein
MTQTNKNFSCGSCGKPAAMVGNRLVVFDVHRKCFLGEIQLHVQGHLFVFFVVNSLLLSLPQHNHFFGEQIGATILKLISTNKNKLF